MKIIADENIPFVAECFGSIGQIEVLPAGAITARAVRDADALIVRSVTKVDAELLQGSNVRFVGTATIGFDHLDVDYLRRNGIGFASAPGSNANSVAEYVVAALLDVASKLGLVLEGKSIGIIGVGNVGGRVAEKCRALGMHLYLNDPPLARQSGDEKYLPLEQLFDCDIVTLHTPLTFEGPDKTYHLAGESFFKLLKDGCVFINTARGAVTETTALKAAVKAGKLGAAVLDVWENEPDIDAELLEMVDIGTPHIAGYSLDGKVAGMIMIYDALCEYFGLQKQFAAESFLPPPQKPEISINAENRAEQELLLEAVAAVYDIKRDDAALRSITELPANDRAAWFTRLRKEYPVRREFHNTTVHLAAACPETLRRKLEGIGFVTG